MTARCMLCVLGTLGGMLGTNNYYFLVLACSLLLLLFTMPGHSLDATCVPHQDAAC